MGKLDGKTAIVTGAGRGIGRAIAIDYGREGANVVVSSRTASTVESVVKEVQAAGGEAIGITCDVGCRDQIKSMVDQTVAKYGTVDILVNNAQGFGTAEHPTGSPVFHKVEDFPDDEWDFTFLTGLKATLWGMQEVFPYMKESGGKIINFGSGNGIGAMKGTAAYNATKEGIRALSRTAANEWGRYNIMVNVIIPTIVTDSARDFLGNRPGVEEKLLAGIPLRRMGDVDRDIGPVAVFLASSDSDFITGQAINVDGGQILRP
ncbi:MAG: family NAD(P)-dependent oxidoreductase [Acidimicrobiia bacterium]|nr:family NAD(P)-dependent oxidoreductase [Acidimicrobiia bacterium]